MGWMDATTAVLESTVLVQALSAPILVARRVRKDGFKMYQGLRRAILARVLWALDLATKDWTTLVVLEFHQVHIRTKQEFRKSVKRDTSA